ncbi:MAG: hypothetical protein GWP59_06665 [Chlamydiales bacterium]|nr:hypothetical protein [Chlamydiales bacterium]
MFTKKYYYIFILLLSLLSKTYAETPSFWHQATENDLNAIVSIIDKHYPAHSLPGQNQVKSSQELAYKQALESLKDVDSYEDYNALLRRFISSYKNPMLRLQAKLQPITKLWPGFLVSYQRGGFYVSSVTNDKQRFSSLPPYGAKLERCNQQSPEEFIEEHLLPYFTLEKNPASLAIMAPHIFSSKYNLLYGTLKDCEFSFEQENFSIQLGFKYEESKKIDAHLGKVFYENRYDISFKDYLENGLWVSLPHFSPQGTSEEKLLNNLLKTIEHPKKKDLIVIDLRSNSDLSLEWPVALFRSLYGKDTVNYFHPIKTRDAFLVYKKTDRSLEFLQNSGITPYDNFDVKALFNKTLPEYSKEEIANYDQFIVAPSPLDSLKVRPSTLEKPDSFSFLTKIFILINSKTSGASLVFLDLMMSMPNTVLIGSPTQNGTPYCAPQNFELPSGLLFLECPLAFFTPFERKPTDYFTPDYLHFYSDDADNNIETFVEETYQNLKSPVIDSGDEEPSAKPKEKHLSYAY